MVAVNKQVVTTEPSWRGRLRGRETEMSGELQVQAVALPAGSYNPRTPQPLSSLREACSSATENRLLLHQRGEQGQGVPWNLQAWEPRGTSHYGSGLWLCPIPREKGVLKMNTHIPGASLQGAPWDHGDDS